VVFNNLQRGPLSGENVDLYKSVAWKMG